MTTLSVIQSSLGSGATTTANTTQYWYLDGGAGLKNAETNVQSIVRVAGTIQNMYVRITANSTTATTAFAPRKNASSTGILSNISVTGGTTGEIEDTTSSDQDSVTAGDKWCWRSVPPSAGTLTVTVIGCLFNTTTNTSTPLVATSGVTSTRVANTAFYNPVCGIWAMATANQTESNAKCRQRQAGTYKYLYVNLTSNSGTTTLTWNSRLSSAPGGTGNITLQFTTNATGYIEDTSNSDNPSAGDDYDIACTCGNSTETFVLGSQGVTFTSTAGMTILCTANPGVAAQTASTTRYNPIKGLYSNNTSTESNVQRKAQDNYLYSNMTLNVTANGASTNGTLSFRKNAANASQSISVTNATTGIFSDTSNIDNVISTDEINYAYASGATSTTTIVNASVSAVHGFKYSQSESPSVSDSTPTRKVVRQQSTVFWHQ